MLRTGKIANMNKRMKSLEATSNQTVRELDTLEARVVALETRVDKLLRSIQLRLSAVETGLDEVTRLVSPAETTYHCGCLGCGDSAWNTQAPAGAGAQFTCGSRIQYLESGGMSHLDACRQIAATELPTECSVCNPDSCSGAGPFLRTPAPSPTPPLVPAPTPPLDPSTPLYCYPDYNSRTRWTNVWGQYQVEVKQDMAGGVCGPGNNKFTSNTVSLANANELTLQYKKVGATWEASEVRVLLPQNLMPFSYGTYKFSIKSVSTIDSSTGRVLAPNLSEDLVLGLFTWDDTEDYASHENYNHEVDIEISRWGDPNNADAQFVVQPPEDPHYHRFFTGAGNTYSPGGKTYEFTWNPTSISWLSSGGETHSYTTKQALESNLPDYVQCLPANMEVRLNIWNKNGPVAPAGMADTHIAQVVVDGFTFTPSHAGGVANGETCSKDCQCLAPLRCINNKCAAS